MQHRIETGRDSCNKGDSLIVWRYCILCVQFTTILARCKMNSSCTRVALASLRHCVFNLWRKCKCELLRRRRSGAFHVHIEMNIDFKFDADIDIDWQPRIVLINTRVLRRFRRSFVKEPTKIRASEDDTISAWTATESLATDLLYNLGIGSWDTQALRRFCPGMWSKFRAKESEEWSRNHGM